MTTDGAAEGWVSQIKRAWLLPPLLKQLQKRQREQALLEKLGDCLDLLYQDPRQPGLNLETLHTTTPQPVLSARIDRGNRLILTPSPGLQVGLLYFDKHDEAYDWVRRQGQRLGTLLSKQREAPRGTRFSQGLTLLPVLRADEDSGKAPWRRRHNPPDAGQRRRPPRNRRSLTVAARTCAGGRFALRT